MFQYTIDKRLGLFSEEEAEVNPLAVYEGCSIEAKPPFVVPHHLWVQVSSRSKVTVNVSVSGTIPFFCC